MRKNYSGERDEPLRAPDWRDGAACKNSDPEMFFPVGDTSRVGAKLALAVCARCDVVNQCAEYALQNEKFGVWGGMSEDELNRLKSLQTRLARRQRIATRVGI